MPKVKDVIQLNGVVIESLPGTQFKLELENGHSILAHIAGKMRKIISSLYQEMRLSWNSRHTIFQKVE